MMCFRCHEGMIEKTNISVKYKRDITSLLCKGLSNFCIGDFHLMSTKSDIIEAQTFLGENFIEAITK